MKLVAGVNNCGFWLVVEKDTGKVFGKYKTPEELIEEWGGNSDVDMSFVEEAILEKSLAEYSGPKQEDD